MGIRFGRRRLIQAGAAVGLAASIPFARRGVARAAGEGSGLETQVTEREAAVIGSGFGGSVAALRLALAGVKTAVIERGRHWAYTGYDTFPLISKLGNGDGRTTWLSNTDANAGTPVNRYTGLLERIAGDTMGAVVPAAYGGGSVVFGGVLLQPRQEIFEQVFPGINYKMMQYLYYPRVLAALSGGPIPNDVLDSPTYAAQKAFIADATAAGLDVVKSHVAFDWKVIRDEIAGRIAPAASIGEYAFGCNSNAKKTLDKNYLRAAEKTGRVSVFTLHNVITITQDAKGRYEVHCDVLSEDGTVVAKHLIRCKHLFMAAGSINTTKLLLKAKASGTLGINDEVGKGWGNNGDYLIARVGVTSPVGTVQGGPPSIAAFDATGSKTVAFMHSPTNRGMPFQMHMSMSVPDALGSIQYDAAGDRALVSWPYADNAPSRALYQASIAKMSAVSGGMVLGEERMAPQGTAWHPLGGVVMNKATNDVGELHGLKNLYVVDGSLLPGSAAAANPSLTIAANAERIMDKLILERLFGC